jgi:hypothetical protein
MKTIEENVAKAMTKLSQLTFSHVEEIKELEIILKEALVKNPKNATIAISLLQAKVMLGKPREGIDLAENIWSVGGSISKRVEGLYISLLNSLCMFNHSKAILKSKIDKPLTERNKFPDLPNLLMTCYVGLGDIDTLKKISSLEEMGELGTMLEGFCDQIIEDGGKDHFTKQQKVLRKAMYGKCASYEVLLSDDEGYPEIEIGVFAGNDSVSRYQLQQKIDDAYNLYYNENGFIPLDNFLITVYDIKEHWGFDGSIDD